MDSNMDEGDQILCTPMRKLVLKDQIDPNVAGDVIVDSKCVDKPKTDSVLGSIIRKKEPSATELAANALIFKRMSTKLGFTNSDCAFRGFLDTLYKLAVKEQPTFQSLLSGVSTATDEGFTREGYTTLVTPKQRLFTMCAMAVDTPLPTSATELFLSNLENSINESVLVPILETFGPLINLRIPFDPKTGRNRGFAFAIFSTPQAAAEASSKLNQSNLLGKVLLAKITNPKKRLIIGNLPKSRSVEDLQHHFKAFLPGFKQAILPPVITIVKLSPSGVPQTADFYSRSSDVRNQGFCFLEFYGSKEASLAKKVISTRKVFGVDLFVDWAEGDEMDSTSLPIPTTAHFGKQLSYYDGSKNNIYN